MMATTYQIYPEPDAPDDVRIVGALRAFGSRNVIEIVTARPTWMFPVELNPGNYVLEFDATDVDAAFVVVVEAPDGTRVKVLPEKFKAVSQRNLRVEFTV